MINPSIHIRQSNANDALMLLQLFHEHALYEGHELRGLGQLKDLEEDAHPAVIFVAEINNTILGYMSLLKQFSTWDMKYYLYIDCLYLSPNSRGKGLGKKLVLKASDYARELGLSEAQWQTPIDNINAIGFYRKCGAFDKDKKRFYWTTDAIA